MEGHREALVRSNRGRNHIHTLAVNPAFQFVEFDSLPKYEDTENYTPNHLIYRRKADDSGKISQTNFHRSVKPASSYRHKFDTTSLRIRKTNLNSNLIKSWTLGRSCTSTTFRNAQSYSRTPRGLVKARNYISRYRNILRNRDCISFFDIETDQAPNYTYRPGETISGRITIIVKKAFEMRLVQMVACGEGQLTRYVSGDEYSRTFRESYFNMDQYLMESSDCHVSSLLSPGQYTSRFCFKLPTDLPSSIHHKDVVNGFVFDVSYTLKARVCVNDDVTPLWHTSAHYGKLRIILEKKVCFTVERDFDINAVPGAMSPIVHTEQIYLTCAHQEAATVSVNTDRAVFLAGDDIRMYLQVSLPASQSVKDIKCCLQEHVITDSKKDPIIFSFSKIKCKDPKLTDEKPPGATGQNFVVNIPTDTQLLSSFCLGNSRINVEYFLSVGLRFIPAGGKLSFKIPVGIGPCAKLVYSETLPRRAIPFFNRTIRFPFFSARKLPESSSTQVSDSSRSASVVVRTKYSNGLFPRVFLCCFGAVD